MREWLTGVQITNDQIQVVGAEVLKHGRAMSEAKGGLADLIACMVMENDLLIGGATGRTEFRRLFVSYLWIDAQSRGKGLGAETLRRIEGLAIERGCVDALIETLDDDVAKWYARCGYKLIACLPDYCGPWSRHTLLKSFER
ncbi:GNAT family N-acetyltransferase [Pseudomonas coronafaciens]|uniref:GNAT family N-acetyltransferase n=1 Tax=Pseudomonas coronafaciens pv. coronafaciens TaxID=235275 RepID=A0AAE6QKM8_9PSED|nr:GNAT family N-acetyltransferase [Pseudomonas coronafaciens]KPW35340.1 N-acetyltransferase GCN5 [Pseudomonas coronafaciens pv. atropurpurea]QGT83318.1 GNAT family N-acetyltransferase [Pseudomonas coronafaciens pv. coronafaciens]QIQ71118.1 Acetyltransferase [Pseudomonas coronafaciens]RMM83939.1 N-acetyltransferase GCN5 [Pseudomonas coronafaciens pv. striafaciens]RMT55875.1 N-acetyltransferase GCN5 [Pseudomonas coronafaciens pv. atropurpurea]